jgi:hypothetical protein
MQEIWNAKPCQHLIIAAAPREGSRPKPSIQVKYEVLEIGLSSNVAIIRAVEASDKLVLQGKLPVRCDCIPEHFRVVGAAFSLSGNPLEIDLFQRSGPQSLGFIVG